MSDIIYALALFNGPLVFVLVWLCWLVLNNMYWKFGTNV